MLAIHETARQQMIKQQIRTFDVLDPAVLGTLASVPRELFVPAAYRSVAYADTQIPLAQGQHMLQPKVDGRILQALAPRRSDAALEIGSGSGYLAACLSAMAGYVVSLEIHAELAQSAHEALRASGAPNTTVECCDAFAWSTDQLFDVIAVTASMPVYDPRFERWLKPGGRLFVVVGSGPIMQARRITRAAAGCTSEVLFETSIDALTNAQAAPGFRF